MLLLWLVLQPSASLYFCGARGHGLYDLLLLPDALVPPIKATMHS